MSRRRSAPSVVFTEIPGERGAAFDAVVAQVMNRPGPDRYRRAPLITGRITRLNGAPVELDRIATTQRWAFDKDILLSALAGAPDDANVVSGRWWPAGYAGPPQVAMARELAKGGRPEGRRHHHAPGPGPRDRRSHRRPAQGRSGGFGSNFLDRLDAHAIAGRQPAQRRHRPGHTRRGTRPDPGAGPATSAR